MRLRESGYQRIIREELGDRSVRDLRELTGNYLLDFLEIEGAWEIVQAIRNPTEPDSLIYVWREVLKGGKKRYTEWVYDFPLDGFGVNGVSFEELGVRDAKIKLSLGADDQSMMGVVQNLEDYGAPNARWFRDNVQVDMEIRVPDFDQRRRPEPGRTIPLIKLYSGVFKGETDATGNYAGYFGEQPRLGLVMPPRAASAIRFILVRRARAVFETVIRRQVRRILAGSRL
jgi:hypothetical protein